MHRRTEEADRLRDPVRRWPIRSGLDVRPDGPCAPVSGETGARVQGGPRMSASAQGRVRWAECNATS